MRREITQQMYENVKVKEKRRQAVIRPNGDLKFKRKQSRGDKDKSGGVSGVMRTG